MGLREWRNSLIYPNPLQVLKERPSRLTHLSMRRSGALVTTIYRLGRQCSAPSGACACLATCDNRARTNPPASLDRPATGADRRVPTLEGIIQIGDVEAGDETADLTLELAFPCRFDRDGIHFPTALTLSVFGGRLLAGRYLGRVSRVEEQGQG